MENFATMEATRYYLTCSEQIRHESLITVSNIRLRV